MAAQLRQEMGELKRYGIQAGWFPADVSVYWANNDSAAHDSTWTADDGTTHRTNHRTLQFKWSTVANHVTTHWVKVAHMDCDARGNHTGTTWFQTRAVP